jgi:hypothetical protein
LRAPQFCAASTDLSRLEHFGRRNLPQISKPAPDTAPLLVKVIVELGISDSLPGAGVSESRSLSLSLSLSLESNRFGVMLFVPATCTPSGPVVPLYCTPFTVSLSQHDSVVNAITDSVTCSCAATVMVHCWLLP